MGRDKPASETDEGSDHSSNDNGQATSVDSGDHGQATGVDFPSRVNTLKPQIDKIFSDVQKLLPDIDFESSGNESDEEPIFPPHLTGARDVFDDDKDLDTSPRPEDYPHGSPENISLQSPEKNKNVSAVMEEEAELFDNDLAAFRSTMAFPTDGDIQKWRILSQSAEDSTCQLEAQEAADLRKAWVLRCATEAEISTEKCSVIKDTGGEATNSEPSDSTNFRTEDNNRIEVAGDPVDNNSLVPETVKKFHLRLQEGLKAMDLAEPQKTFFEEARSKVDDIMSTFKFQEQIILSREHFEELNLDSVLDATHEENNPMNLQIPSHSSGQRAGSQIGSDDEKMIDAPEELTLIQKLANLTMRLGGNVEALRSLDPHTGAAKTRPRLRTDKSQISDNRNMADESHISETGCQASGTSTACAGTSTACAGTSTACAGTSTASDPMKPEKPSRHLKPEETDLEPQRVHLDNQIFERLLEDKKPALGQSKESSSSDEEMVSRNDRDNWHLTRQKMKKLLNKERTKVDTARGASVSKEDIIHDTSVTKEDLAHSEAESKKGHAHCFYPDIRRQNDETHQPDLKDPLEVSTEQQENHEMESSSQATQAATPQKASYGELCQAEDKPKKKKCTRKGKTQNKDDYHQKKREAV